MFLRVLILLSAIAGGAGFGFAQDSLVKFYPVGDAILCKGCGHLRNDYWRLRFRLENTSETDLVVYGQQNGERGFHFLNQVQYRNPHTCEWQYATRESKRRVVWRDMRDYEKVPFLLKAGDTLISDAGFDAHDDNTPTRFTAFVGRRDGGDPQEIFSRPYHVINGNAGSYRVVEDTCSPKCAAGTESPVVRGIRLGVTLKAFQRQFPYIKTHRLHRDLFNYRTAYIWDWQRDAYSVSVTFVDDKVARIEPHFRSLNKARERENFWELVSSKIGFPFYWTPYRGGWDCSDFVVEVISNEDPTITIQTKYYITVRDKLNEETLRKMK